MLIVVGVDVAPADGVLELVEESPVLVLVFLDSFLRVLIGPFLLIIMLQDPPHLLLLEDCEVGRYNLVVVVLEHLRILFAH